MLFVPKSLTMYPGAPASRAGSISTTCDNTPATVAPAASTVSSSSGRSRNPPSRRGRRLGRLVTRRVRRRVAHLAAVDDRGISRLDDDERGGDVSLGRRRRRDTVQRLGRLVGGPLGAGHDRHLAGDVSNAAQRGPALHAELLADGHLRAAPWAAHGSETTARLPSVTGRFAPSPTGPLHVGNLRTALVAWIVARSAGERFIVRMEDLDRSNASADHETRQLADLDMIGIDWDGPVVERAVRPLSRGDCGAAVRRPRLRVLLHSTRDRRGGGRPARSGSRLSGHLPRAGKE